MPKYLSPRTDTPRLTLGHGGYFGAIYSVRGAGGYQMFGVVAPPIYDPTQRLADFATSSVLFRPGDLVRYRAIDANEHAAIQRSVEDGTYCWHHAPVPVPVDGVEHANWSRIELDEGQTLSFGVIRGGTRFWIAVRGGIDVPIALGSRSTYLIGAIGGVGGRAVRAGDVLPIGMPTAPLPRGDSFDAKLLPRFERSQTARIVLGPCDHLLTDEGTRRLVEEEWTLTPTADRMGLRYSGPGVEWRERQTPFGAGQDPSNIVDAGYAVGSIQIPGGTQPIVLHRDAFSGGGYAMVATVISADMDLLARAAPGTVIRFVSASMADALAARQARRKCVGWLVDSFH